MRRALRDASCQQLQNPLVGGLRGRPPGRGLILQTFKAKVGIAKPPQAWQSAAN